MGLKIFKIGDEREALELKCDSSKHRDKAPVVWFDCGSHTGNLALATASGWRERRNANGAWLACAVMAYNLSRAAGVLAGGKLRKARTATIRTTLINIPARAAFSAGTYTLHLPANSRRETLFMTMFDDIQAPPQAA